MAFTLKIDTGNAAFDGEQASEVAIILRELAGKLDMGGYNGGGNARVLDTNGNTVGEWNLDPREAGDE